jgi:hypothetical protein
MDDEKRLLIRKTTPPCNQLIVEMDGLSEYAWRPGEGKKRTGLPFLGGLLGQTKQNVFRH